MFDISTDYGFGFEYRARVHELVHHAELDRMAAEAVQARRDERIASRAARRARHAQ